jgi:hypothetical protein
MKGFPALASAPSLNDSYLTEWWEGNKSGSAIGHSPVCSWRHFAACSAIPSFHALVAALL